VRNHKGWVDLLLDDSAQQIAGPAVDVGLPRPQRQAFVHQRAKWDLIQQPAIDARHRKRAGWPADIDHLAQNMRPVGLEHHRLLGAVIHRVERAQ
jgi:hypothetical protein